MGVRQYYLIFFLIFISNSTQAIQYGISEIENFNRRDYNAGTQNWSISQADNGLMYFANNDGIIEYDGTTWRLLPKVVNSITRAVLAHNDRVYIGTNDAFGYYESDSLKNFRYYSLNKRYNLNNVGDFWKIFEFDGKIIFQSEDALCIYSPEDGVDVIRAHSRFPTSFMVNGMLLVHDEKLGLLELRQGKLFRIPGGEIFSEYAPWAILPLNNDEIVIGTMNNGLFKWGLSGFEKWNVPASDYLKKNNVFCGAVTGDELMFGTIQSGAVVVDKTGNIKMVADKDRGLNNNTVLSMFVDEQKNVWCGLDNGISKVQYNRAVSFIQGYYDTGTGYCMERKRDNVFLGTNQGLYSISEEKFEDPLKTRNDFKRVEGTNGQVWSLFNDTMTNKVLCGHNLGVFVVDGLKANRITPQNVNGAWTFRIIPGHADWLITGTYGGLSVIKRSGNSWKFSHKINGFDDSSRFIEWADDDALWVVHGVHGIFKLYFNDDFTEIKKIQTFHDFNGLEDSINFTISEVNNKVLFTSDHGLYFTDSNGIDFYRSEFEEYFTDYNKFPTKIKQDRFGNIWYFINDGVGVLRRQEDGTYKHIYNPLLTLKDKLVSGFESVYFFDEETTFFGVEDGVGQYSVVSDINYYQPFDVHIRQFRNQSAENDYDEFYTSSLNENTQKYKPVYPFEHNNFGVGYSATWFGNSEVEYTTWLDGFEQSWQPWTNTTTRQFTRLPEGDYVFKVKARNMFGVESLPATFNFSVSPPWYRSSIANTVYMILILLFMVLMWFITSRLVQKAALREKDRQKDKFRKREEALRNEALINEKEMIRLRNEKLRNDMVHKEKELANSTMNIVQKNEFLEKIKNELLKIDGESPASTIDKKVASVIRKIERDIKDETHWEVFETHFEQVHEAFLKRLSSTHNSLTARELRLAAYLRMNMSSKEIASLMNITSRAVENNRSRLRKKLDLSQGENLVDYIFKI